ncbi:ribonuclease III domain-containing protein, partial [Prochlorococcus sp. SS52]
MTKKDIVSIVSKERAEEIYGLLTQSNLHSSDIEVIKKNEDYCLKILNEALTHTSFNLSINHERLEFQGDAVLRLAASEYIQSHFPKLSVG